jgi:sporulation protein YlmC with PRC-barrel domain
MKLVNQKIFINYDYGEKMVEVSSLYNLDIYTVAGQYVGRIDDIILNIRLGTIAKLQVKAIETDNKHVGLADVIKKGLQIVPDENQVRTFQEAVLSVDYDKVRAIGDIMLIDPDDLKQTTEKPKVSSTQ